MPPKPPVITQDDDISCAVVCLAMVLSAHGLEVSPDELRAKVDCFWDGTRRGEPSRAAKEFGFVASRTYTLTFDELVEVVELEVLPIVLVKRRVNDRVQTLHAVVVASVTPTHVLLLDPDRNKGEWWQARREFAEEWRRAGNEATLILKEPIT